MAIYELGERKPALAQDAYVFDTAVVIGDVRMAERSSIWPGAIARGDNDPIIIGRGSNVQDGSVLHTDVGSPLIIGDEVTIGHQVMLHGCTIGDGSLIGMQAIVLDGARIGKNCLIGAGALISGGKEIPDGSLVMGRPGKIVRTLGEDEIAMIRRGNKHYQERAREYREQLRRIG